MQLFSLRRRKSFQPSTTALRFVEDPRLHSCPYGSNGTQGTRKSLFLVLFYIYIGSGRESRPVLFPAGSQGLPLRYPFHRITTPNCAEPASTDAPLLCKSPPIGSFRRYPRASPEKGSLLPLVSVSRKERKAHPVMRPYFYFRTFHLTTLLRRSVRTTAPAILSKLRTVSGSAHQHSSPTAEKRPAIAE